MKSEIISFVLFALTMSTSSKEIPALYSLALDSPLTRLTQVDPVELAAVGRVATLGELYDARTDKFLRMSLINGNYSSFIKTTDKRYSNLKYLKLNTLEEKLDNLNVQAGFKLSILFGIVEVSGSGKFISDKQHSSGSSKVSVANFVTTKFDKIDMTDPDVLKFINLDVLQKIDATHVVVGIEWGGNVVVSVEDYNSEGHDKQTVQGSLGGKLEFFVGSISVNGEVNLSGEELKQFSKFSFELYGDILPNELPTTLVEAIVLMKSVPKLLTEGNAGKGKALTYTMLPIPLLRELLSLQADMNSLVASIDGSTVRSCIKLLEEMDIDQLKIKDLLVEMNNFQKFISKEKLDKVNMFANSYQIYQIELKRRLAEKLVSVKSGNETVNKIIGILNEAYLHKLSPLNIDFDQFLSLQSEFQFIKLLLDLNVNVLDKGTTLNEFMSVNLNKNVYAFFYTVDFPNLSDEPMIAFRKIVETRKQFDPDGVFVAIKFDVLRDIERKTYFNFNQLTRLRMYKNGICIIDNYSITSKPPNEPESALWSLPYMQAQIVQLIKNPVPVYYTYVQYPNMPEPGKLWPSLKWMEITSRYAGLFFRAAGGSANCFNCTTQEAISPMITGVYHFASTSPVAGGFGLSYNNDETMSPWLGTGGQGGAWMSIRFKTKNKEVIPRNRSIRIWERSP